MVANAVERLKSSPSKNKAGQVNKEKNFSVIFSTKKSPLRKKSHNNDLLFT